MNNEDILKPKVEEVKETTEKPVETPENVETIDLNEVVKDNEQLKKENEELKTNMQKLNEKFDLLLTKPTTTKIIMPQKAEPVLKGREKLNDFIDYAFGINKYKPEPAEENFNF